MKVVILCGDKGTRLHKETKFRPKPTIPIGGQPILWHIMKIYARHGHREFSRYLGYISLQEGRRTSGHEQSRDKPACRVSESVQVMVVSA